MADFAYQEMFPFGEADTPWRLVTSDHVSTMAAGDSTVLNVAPEALSELAFEAMRDIAHLFRPGHLAQLRAILDDPEATDNDRYVALE